MSLGYGLSYRAPLAVVRVVTGKTEGLTLRLGLQICRLQQKGLGVDVVRQLNPHLGLWLIVLWD